MMMRQHYHSEHHAQPHKSKRAPYLRAALMGANDGLVSTAALIMSVSAANLPRAQVTLTGFAALVSGGLSMFVGEYVSVSAQRDAELADIKLEQRQHDASSEYELNELTQIYISRGVAPELAHQVATQLSTSDALRVHVREELGLDMDNLSRPWIAAFSSGISFCIGSGIPLLTSMVVGTYILRILLVAGVSCVGFLIFGLISAKLGGANVWRASLRILIGGTLALGFTYLIGYYWNEWFPETKGTIVS